MNDDPKGKLPGSSRELSVYRKPTLKAKSVLERLDALLIKHWGKNPKLHAVLTTRVFNGTSIEGTPLADKHVGAFYVRQLAVDEGDDELAKLPVAELANKIGVVLRRYDFTPLVIE